MVNYVTLNSKPVLLAKLFQYLKDRDLLIYIETYCKESLKIILASKGFEAFFTKSRSGFGTVKFWL